MGALGITDPLAADASTARALGGLAAALPVAGGIKAVKGLKGALTLDEAARAAQAARATKGIRAYHGSPHEFERFDLSKIGTGEGAQTYGHGLYFAESEPVANFYRAKLAPRPEVLVGGEPVAATPSTPAALFGPKQADQTIAARIANKMHQQETIGRPIPLEDALAHIEAELDQGVRRAAAQNTPELWQSLMDQRIALQRFREQGVSLTRPGHMYEVNLDVDPEHLLDWDKRVTAQTPYVQGAIRRAEPDLDLEPWARGEEIHDVLGAQGLREAGIPGLRFLDQFSRPKGSLFQAGNGNWFIQGSSTPYATEAAAQAALDASGNVTRNYVMFRDDLVNILRKYGILAPLAATPALNALRQGNARDQVGTAPPPPVR
jgi:hypothetical protein